MRGLAEHDVVRTCEGDRDVVRRRAMEPDSVSRLLLPGRVL